MSQLKILPVRLEEVRKHGLESWVKNLTLKPFTMFLKIKSEISVPVELSQGVKGLVSNTNDLS